jgi:hypothetical protein
VAVETIVDFGQDESKPAMLGSVKDPTAKTSLTMACVPRLHSAIRMPVATHGHD